MPTSARRTLTLSILDGVFYSVMVGAGETYFSPYAIALGASNLVLGLLLGLPVLVGSLSQIFSERLLGLLGTRRRVLVLSVALQAACFVPMIAVSFTSSPLRAVAFLGLVCAYWIFQLIAGPAWSSLMGDLVPEATRGAYFARRSRYLQLATFLTMLLAGAALTAFRERGLPLEGFAAVFLVAMAARLVSMGFLWRHHEPPMAAPPSRRTWTMVLEVLKNPAQRRLIRYLTTMNFAVYLSAPYFAAYMLRTPDKHGLAWSYSSFTVITAISVASKFLFLPLWGHAADRFGSRKCLTLSAWLILALPLPWLFPTTSPALHFAVILVSQVWAGLAWAGHELCSFNFQLDSAPPADRARLISAINAINGVMLFLGASLGAVLVVAVPEPWNPFFVVFVASSAVRLLTCVVLLPKLKEVRVVEHISYRDLLFRVVAVRPQLGAMLRFFALPRRGADDEAPR
ncbi:MAG: MFS transporter [Myxococcota bacterium]